MAKQDDKQRARRRLQNQAVDLAAKNRWEEAADLNKHLLDLGEDVDTHNRLGKAYFELGRLEEARDSYRSALRIMPNNPIARKNLERIDDLLARGATAGPSRAGRELVDLRLFITEIGKTALTTLIDVTRRAGNGAVVTGEKVVLLVNGRHINILDAEGNLVGRLEPKLTQRLVELIAGGNRYAAAVAQVSGGHTRILLREVFQDPAMRDRVSFPGKLSESALRGGFISSATYDDYSEDVLDDDDGNDDREEIEEESFGNEEEDLGLDEIEQDINEEEDMGEE
ncbi:MAG: tetratricopeptide repeat protein [Roseiflexaceae bacterium]|nr:tetratricopeptide repeat protein [Roseiflexaceae bacterium]